ncbi:MAG: DUF3093 domain-containing protein [Actinomycetes bacterium]
MNKFAEITLYRERIVPGLSFYLATLFVPVALFLIVLAFDEYWALLAFVTSELLIVGVSISFSPLVIVSEAELRVGRVKVPTVLIGKVSSISKADAFVERGPNLDPNSFLRFQIGVRGLVKINIVDPKDPPPYWLVSTRQPKRLVEALTRKD